MKPGSKFFNRTLETETQYLYEHPPLENANVSPSRLMYHIDHYLFFNQNGFTKLVMHVRRLGKRKNAQHDCWLQAHEMIDY